MKTRRNFLKASAVAAAALPRRSSAEEPEFGDWKSLFDGDSLRGWKAVPRIGVHKLLLGPNGKRYTRDSIEKAAHDWHRENGTPRAVFDHVGKWEVVNGAIVGGQKPPGSRLGAYLMTEAEYGDFELEYDIHPDWPTDTGVLIRQHPIGTIGIQILCDHRPGGGIGGIYTNGLGSYIASPFVVQGDSRDGFQVENLREGEKDTRFKQGRVENGVSFAQFREVWKLNDFNRFRVRAIGADPVVTIWINGLKMGRIRTADPGIKDYDSSQIQRLVGKRGHIGLEVHSNGPAPGWTQWGVGAVCRWKNIRVREVVS